MNAADYVTASIEQRGRANLVIFAPDGRLLRRFPAPAADGPRSIAFVAEEAGLYRLEFAPATAQPASYTLKVSAVMAVGERLKDARPKLNRSARIEAVRRRIAAGDVDTTAFWRQVAAEGTPVIEPFETDGKYRLVTFLWRAGPDVHNVYVFGSMRIPSFGPSDYAMRHIDRSDIWYLTVKMPAGARFS